MIPLIGFMDPHIDLMDPLRDFPYRFQRSLIDYMDPLTDLMDSLLDSPYRFHGSPYRFDGSPYGFDGFPYRFPLQISWTHIWISLIPL